MSKKEIQKRTESADAGDVLGGLFGAANKFLDDFGVPGAAQAISEQDAKWGSNKALELAAAKDKTEPDDYRRMLVEALTEAYKRGQQSGDIGVTDE